MLYISLSFSFSSYSFQECLWSAYSTSYIFFTSESKMVVPKFWRILNQHVLRKNNEFFASTFINLGKIQLFITSYCLWYGSVFLTLVHLLEGFFSALAGSCGRPEIQKSPFSTSLLRPIPRSVSGLTSLRACELKRVKNYGLRHSLPEPARPSGLLVFMVPREGSGCFQH